jgi:hypothetical protein
MGRKAKIDNRKQLDLAISEELGPAKKSGIGKTEFYGLVAKNYGQRVDGNENYVSIGWVQQAIKRHKLTIDIESQKGMHTQTGEHAEKMRQARGKRTSRAEKFAANPAIVEAHKNLRQTFPTKQKVVDKIVNDGSLKAAVALKCWDCSGGLSSEVSSCVLNNCPLWAFRPNAEKSELVEIK